MSMLDCERCWDTPCHCGHEGYVAVCSSTKEGTAKIMDLKPEAYERVLKKLQALLDELLSKENP